MKFSRQSVWLLRIVVSLVIFYLLYTRIPFADVMTAMAAAHVWLVVLSLVLTCLARYIGAMRMKMLTEKQAMGFSAWALCKIGMIATFYGLFLPGFLSGGVIRWYRLYRPEKKGSAALVCIALDRLVDTSILVLMGIVLWCSDRTRPADHTMMLGLLPLLTGLFILFALILREKSCTFFHRTLQGIRATWMPKVLRIKAGKLGNVVRSYHRLPLTTGVVLLGLSLLRHLMLLFAFYLLCLSVHMDISWITVGWVQVVTQLAGMFPLSFAGLGVREGVLLFLFLPYDIPSVDVLAVSFLAFGKMVCIGLGGGVFEAQQWFARVEKHSVSENVV